MSFREHSPWKTVLGRKQSKESSTLWSCRHPLQDMSNETKWIWHEFNLNTVLIYRLLIEKSSLKTAPSCFKRLQVFVSQISIPEPVRNISKRKVMIDCWQNWRNGRYKYLRSKFCSVKKIYAFNLRSLRGINLDKNAFLISIPLLS